MKKEHSPGKATGYRSDADSVDSILAWEDEKKVPVSQIRSLDDSFMEDYYGYQRDVEGLPETSDKVSEPLPIRTHTAINADYNRKRQPKRSRPIPAVTLDGCALGLQ